jgi:low temperature requirement protein LtrA
MITAEWVGEREFTRQQWTTFIIIWLFIAIKKIGHIFHHKFQGGNASSYFQMDTKVWTWVGQQIFTNKLDRKLNFECKKGGQL